MLLSHIVKLLMQLNLMINSEDKGDDERRGKLIFSLLNISKFSKWFQHSFLVFTGNKPQKLLLFTEISRSQSYFPSTIES